MMSAEDEIGLNEEIAAMDLKASEETTTNQILSSNNTSMSLSPPQSLETSSKHSSNPPSLTNEINTVNEQNLVSSKSSSGTHTPVELAAVPSASSLFKGDDGNDFLTASATPPLAAMKQLFSTSSGSDDFLHTSALNRSSQNSSFSLVNKGSTSSIEQISNFSPTPTIPAVGSSIISTNNLVSSFGSNNMNATSSPTETNYLNGSSPIIPNSNPVHGISPMTYSVSTNLPTGLSYHNKNPYMTTKPQEITALNNAFTPTLQNQNNLAEFKPSVHLPALSSPYSTNIPPYGNQNQQIYTLNQQTPGSVPNHVIPAEIPGSYQQTLACNQIPETGQIHGSNQILGTNQTSGTNPISGLNHQMMSTPYIPTFNTANNSTVVPGSQMPNQNQNTSTNQNESVSPSGLFIPTMYANQKSSATTTSSSFFVPTQPSTKTASTMEPYNPTTTNFNQNNSYSNNNNNSNKQQQNYNQGQGSYQINSQSDSQQSSNGNGGGFWNWITGRVGKDLKQQIKHATDSVLTTLDPGMEEYLNQCIGVGVASQDISVLQGIKQGFSRLLGTANVKGQPLPQGTPMLPVGIESAVISVEETLEYCANVNFGFQSQYILVANKVFLAELVPEQWSVMICLGMKDMENNISTHSFSQPIPLPSEMLQIIYNRTGQQVNTQQKSGYNVTIEEVVKMYHPYTNDEDWCMALTGGLPLHQIILNAAHCLAANYRRKKESGSNMYQNNTNNMYQVNGYSTAGYPQNSPTMPYQPSQTMQPLQNQQQHQQQPQQHQQPPQQQQYGTIDFNGF